MTREPDDAHRKVAGFIRLHGLFAGAKRVLLAVSGGADSMAVVHVLAAIRKTELPGADLLCLHVNHHLRGPAADRDEQFVVEQARALGLPVITQSVDVRGYADAHRLSVETAGRQLRLAAFAEIAGRQGCTWIATGHQKNDNTETIIHRLLRGTGFQGLAGIPPVRLADSDLMFARPLLCLTREEIVRYLTEHGRPWREDHTNADIAYTRNFLRHRLIPTLQQEAQGPLVQPLSELAASATKLNERIGREVELLWPTVTRTTEGKIDLNAAALADSPALVATALIRRALRTLNCGERDLTRHHYGAILQLARDPVANKGFLLPRGFSVRRRRDRIVFLARAPVQPDETATAQTVPTTRVRVPGETPVRRQRIHTEILPPQNVRAAKRRSEGIHLCEHMDFDRIKPPIRVRSRRAGDQFTPLGLTGTKRVGKFLTAAKVPHDLREQVLVFTDREKIIWVCPIRISEQVKITASTQRVLRLTVSDPGESTTREV